MTECWVALGGNVGNVSRTFERALELLDKAPGTVVVQRSRNYSTSAVGTNAGDAFINAVVRLTVQCGPVELLDALQTVELQLGRTRQLRWGPRTLDLDLLFYDQHMVSTPRLTLPHPHLWYRRFVLDPLTEIAADLIHPQHGISVAELRSRLLKRPLTCLLFGGDPQERMALQQVMAATYSETLWQDTATEATWLAFQLSGPSSVNLGSLPIARIIELSAFPTSPAESIRDVLRAALDEVQPI